MNYLYTLSRSTILVGGLTIVLAIIWWIIPTESQPLKISILGEFEIINLPPFAMNILQFISIASIMAFAQSFISSRHIKLITYLHFFIIALIAVCWAETQTNANQIIASMLFIKAFWNILEIDFMEDNAEDIFSSILLASIATILDPNFVLLIPICVITAIKMDGIKARSIISMTFTLAVSTSTIFGVAFLLNSLDIATTYYSKIFTYGLQYYNLDTISRNLPMAIVFIFGVATAIKIFSKRNDFSQKEKSAMVSMIFTQVCISLFMGVFRLEGSGFALIATLISAIFITIGVLDSKSKANHIIFTTFLLLMIISASLPSILKVI